MSKVSEAGKITKYNRTGCEVLNKEKKVDATATRVSNLYYLEYYRKGQNLNVAKKNNEMLWHQRCMATSVSKISKVWQMVN